MRIAVNARYLAAQVTGVQRFAREVGDRLAERDDIVWLVPADVEVPDVLRGREVVRGRLRGHAWEQTELPWRMRAARCDVCLSLAGTLPGAGGPHVGVVHDVLPLTDPQFFSPAFAAWYRIAVGRNARRAAGIVTVSRWSAAQIAATLGVPAERISVAGQGVAPFDHPASAEAVDRARASLGLQDRWILAGGWGDPRKNVSFLVEVMREWRRRDPAAPQLVVVGSTPSRVHGSSAGASPPGDVTLVGRVDDETLRALYTGATAFAFPSLAEGFGRPPLEAAACGTPALVAPYGPAVEVLGEHALVVPLETEAWITQLQRLDRNAAERADLVERAAAVARSRTWEGAAATVLEACAAAITVTVAV